MKLSRILRHRWLDEGDARRALPADALSRLEAAVTQSERRHTGEIRLCIEASLPLSYLWRDADARERALAMFGKLRVWDTEHNNGVLIYLLLAERRIEIVADRALHRSVGDAQWQAWTAEMSASLASGSLEDGLLRVIGRVDAVLAAGFPLPPDGRGANQLADSPVVIG